MNIKRYVLPLAVVAVFSLAGCGGGSSNTDSGDTKSAEEMAMDRAKMQMSDLRKYHSALQSAVAALSGDVTQAAIDAAQSAIDDLEDAIDAAEDVDDTTVYENAVAGAKTSVTNADGRLAKNNQDAQDKMDLERRMKMNAVAMKVAEAINKHTLASAPPGEEFSGAASDSDTMNLAFSRGSGAAMITPYQSAADKKNKPFASSDAPSAGTGWAGKTFTRSGTSAKRAYTDMTAVYTDIEMAGDLAWNNAAFGAINTNLTVTDSTGAVTIAATTNNVAAAHITGILPGIPAAGQTSSVPIPANTERPGSFYGVTGTYTCGGSACTVSRSSSGTVTFAQELTFTPTNFDGDATDGDQTMAKYADADGDYTHFGYWMRSTKQRDGSYEHDIRTFHGGGNGTVLALGTKSGNERLGTAKYYGSAAGVYVKKDGAGDDLEITDGKFTAAAMLTATFGGDDIAEDDQYEVEGTISDFMDGSTDLGFADLMLSRAALTNAGAVTAGGTKGGGATGSWEAQFYGAVNTADDTASPSVTNNYPKDVSGEFNGHFVNGHVAGAFGAEYEE